MRYRWTTSYLLWLLLALASTGCYFINFFREDADSGSGHTAATLSPPDVIGGSLPTKAADFNRALLDSVHTTVSAYPPAAVRPDADVYARHLLLQYREKGDTVARVVGETEGYRLLLGGASQDFQKAPQTEYDATSLLANLTVAEEICQALVAPRAWEHPGWVSILPHAATEVQANIRFLAQRFLGMHSNDIPTAKQDQLKSLMDTHKQAGPTAGADYQEVDYVPVCVALALDVESLLL